jgi:hypothetical protein
VRPPNSQVGALLLATRQQMIATCDLGPAYAQTIDRESAYEILSARAKAAADADAANEAQAAAEKAATKAAKQPRASAPPRASTRASRPPPAPKPSPVVVQAEKVGGTLLNTVARELMRGILGTGSPRRRR